MQPDNTVSIMSHPNQPLMNDQMFFFAPKGCTYNSEYMFNSEKNRELARSNVLDGHCHTAHGRGRIFAAGAREQIGQFADALEILPF